MTRLVLLVGLPGSGKSTWAARRGWNAVSSDAMRLLLSDDMANQAIHARVFATVRYLVRQRLALERPVTCVDATHLTRAERKPYVRIARWYHCKLEAVYFNVAVAVCQARNDMRERRVPDEVLIAMASRLEPPSLEEGFSRIQYI